MSQSPSKSRARTAEDSDGPSKRQRRKFTACQRCHSHKIKCSGDQPCAKCIQVGCASECQYELRDRQVRVSEAYLGRILSENQRLKETYNSSSASQTEPRSQPPPPPTPSSSSQLPATATRTGDDSIGPDESNTNSSAQNPLIGDGAWFHPYDPSAPPIFIGEAACTAFATRFRRFLTGSNATAHIPRIQYVKEANIAAANEDDVRWPARQHARLLVKTALHQIGHIYHMVMRKATLDKLDEIYQTGDFDNTVNQCKFFALFAFGEAYSLRTEPASGSRVPGTSYFARALSLVQVLPERTSITHLETLLLLSLFSYYLNRRHSAYVLIGSAMRLSLCIGMNHNIPASQIIDPAERQHRVRIWWSIYIFDRMWASKMGLPSQILDDDVHLDLPSTISPQHLHDEQFSDTDYLVANVKLARIVGETIAKIYSRRKYTETFLQRVQELLKALKNWVDTLPAHFRLNEEDPEANKKPITSLHLAFNQCVILTTRPTLLHLLLKLSEKTSEPNNNSNANTGDAIPQLVLTLSEACIHAARHSHSIILTKWLNGTLPVFGYFHVHYLFSSALVLAMSCFVPVGSPSDMSGFETALEVLSLMSENGNLAAAEFFQNLQQVKFCLDEYRESRFRKGHAARGTVNALAAIGPGNPSVPPSVSPDSSSSIERRQQHQQHQHGHEGIDMMERPASSNPSVVVGQSPAYQLQQQNAMQNDQFSSLQDVASGNVPTAMTFLEPTMRDFLTRSDFDLGLLNPVDTFMNDAESLYTLHGL